MRIIVKYKALIYEEDKNKIELDVEPLINGKSIIYIPNDNLWNSLYNWALDRKSEIITRIKEELADNYEINKYEFQEY